MATKKKPAGKGRLLEFYGTGCHFCEYMEPVVAKLEKEAKLKVEKIEVWYNEENREMMKKYDKGYCDGVPFFFNEKSGEWICGATEYENLKKWALAK